MAIKKPHPEVYEGTLALLDLPARAAVAIEDPRNGLDAASACAIATLVTPSYYGSGEDFTGAALVCRDLDEPPVDLTILENLVEVR